nr:hypothetical protein [uncultured Brumimicrobium sp.]
MEKTEINLNRLVENKTLTWLPWIGKNYIHSKNKLLIVGESHYYNPEEQSSVDKHQNVNFTRVVINDIGIKKEYLKYPDKRKARLFPNFHKTVFGSDKADTSELWENVAFYNFIQVPMHSNKSRPSTKEIYAGWDSFFKLLDVLQPDRILFIGSVVLDKFEIYSRRNKLNNSKLKYHRVSKNQVSRDFSITLNNKEIPIISIKHCSQYYNVDLWRNYLSKINMFDFIEEQK